MADIRQRHVSFVPLADLTVAIRSPRHYRALAPSQRGQDKAKIAQEMVASAFFPWGTYDGPGWVTRLDEGHRGRPATGWVKGPVATETTVQLGC